jgi:hypothetical protein
LDISCSYKTAFSAWELVLGKIIMADHLLVKSRYCILLLCMQGG